MLGCPASSSCGIGGKGVSRRPLRPLIGLSPKFKMAAPIGGNMAGRGIRRALPLRYGAPRKRWR